MLFTKGVPYFFLLTGINLFSQVPVQEDPLAKFDHYTYEDGLSHEKVLEAEQDQHGFMWFATAYGLNRFDGYHFVTYLNREEDSASLSDNYVTCIEEDRYGNLWIGTRRGLNRFNRKDETFTRYLYDRDDPNSLTHAYIRELYADTSGILWIETVDGTLARYDIQGESFDHFRHRRIIQDFYDYHAIYEDSGGYLWIGGRDMGPYRFNKQKGEFVFFPADNTDSTRKRDNDIACFFEDSHGNFWVSATDGAYWFYPPENRFKKILPTSTYSIMEDSKGFVWLGTGRGAYRYDPFQHSFTLFEHDQNNPSSLTGNHIYQVFEDKQDNVWFCTSHGISKMSPNKYKFYHYRHIPGNANSLAHNHVSAVLQDRPGNIWIGTMGGGLDLFDRSRHRFIHHRHQSRKPSSITSNRVSALYEDPEGNLWVGLWAGLGFNKFDPAGNAFTRYAIRYDSRKKDWYRDFLEDDQGNFWLGIWGDRGVRRFDRYTEQFGKEQFAHDPKPIDQQIISLSNQADTVMWMVTGQNYLVYYTRKDRSFHRINLGYQPDIHAITKKIDFGSNLQTLWNSFDPERLQVVHWDRGSRMIWIGTGNGLLAIDSQNGEVRHFPALNDFLIRPDITAIQSIPEREQLMIGTSEGMVRYHYGATHSGRGFQYVPGMKEGTITAVAANPDKGELWITTTLHLYQYRHGTGPVLRNNLAGMNAIISGLDYGQGKVWLATNKGMVAVDPLTGTETNYPQTASNTGRTISSDLIHSIHMDENSGVWLATHKGLNHYDPERDTIKAWLHDESDLHSLVNNYVTVLEKGFEDEIWIGTSRGLCAYLPKEKTFINHNQPGSQWLSSHLVSDLHQDRQGNIWIGTTNKGLNKMLPAYDSIVHYSGILTDSSGFRGKEVNCIFQGKKGLIWVGTDEGLNRYHPGTDTFLHYNRHHGFPSDQINAILQDERNRLWLGTDNGLLRFNPVTRETRTFNTGDGLQSNYFSGACAVLNTGEMIFGGDHGFNLFHPDSLPPNPYPPEIQITAFKTLDTMVRRDFTGTDTILLRHNENFFSVEFASLDFTAPGNNRYVYKLEGLDREWIYTGEPRVNYTSMAPGQYQLLVKGTNNDGIWSREPAGKAAPAFPDESSFHFQLPDGYSGFSV